MSLWGSGLGRLIVGRKVICNEKVREVWRADEGIWRTVQIELKCMCRQSDD